MTARLSPLPCRPPAIASPATPPPRHMTSNSCGNLLTSFGSGGTPQRLEQRRGRERAGVAFAVEDRRSLGGTGQGGGESFGQGAARVDAWLTRRWAALGVFEGPQVDLDDRHPAHQAFAAQELGDVLARRLGENSLRRVVLGDLP